MLISESFLRLKCFRDGYKETCAAKSDLSLIGFYNFLFINLFFLFIFLNHEAIFPYVITFFFLDVCIPLLLLLYK